MTSNNFYIQNQEELRCLIDRYFEGTSTDADERWIRSMLAGNVGADFEIDAATASELRELIAVSSFAVTAPRRVTVRSRRGSAVRRWASVAASVVAASVIGGYLYLHPADAEVDDTDYIAYVDGHEIKDPSRVMEIMKEELSSMRIDADEPEAAAEQQLKEIGDALNGISHGMINDVTQN